MPTQSGAGVIWSKTEWLGGCSVDHFEDIYAHFIGNYLHFVNQPNIYSSVDILQQLCHLSCFGRTHLNDTVYRLFIESNTNL
ncbi:hypothetical protein D3C78_1398110 [compost metagenome]